MLPELSVLELQHKWLLKYASYANTQLTLPKTVTLCAQLIASRRCAIKPVVITDDSAAGPPDRASPASKFPQSAFAPYNAPGFVWNPPGTGLAMDAFDFPILLLDNVTAPAAIQRANDNAQHVRSPFAAFASM